MTRRLWPLLLVAAAGCASAPPAPLTSAAARAGLPADLPGLLAEAEATDSPLGPAATVERCLAAALTGLDLDPTNDPAARLAARSALWLLEHGSLVDGDARRLAGTVHERTGEVLRGRPGDAESVFLDGALLGQRLRLARVPTLGRLEEVHAAFERAVELDPGYDHGAPLRALGTLLVRAPQWPSGIGDAETGLELLGEASDRFPTHPANALYLAEALADEGSPGEARNAAERVIELCSEPRWEAVCATYRPRAETVLRR